MDFGRKLLGKYGWAEGKGLGKWENGIVAPLKPKLKFDTAGIGFDYSKEFVNDQWSEVYNKTLKDLFVSGKKKKKEESYSEEVKEKDQNKVEKNHFIKTETLLKDGSRIPETNIILPKETSSTVPFDFDLLYKACGGRTAHKGARHGLNLNGKLARLEAQEKNVQLNSLQASAETNVPEKKDLINNSKSSKLTKKKKKKIDMPISSDSPHNKTKFPEIPIIRNELEHEANIMKKKKKKKKKIKESCESQKEVTQEMKSKKRKMKDEILDDVEDDASVSVNFSSENRQSSSKSEKTSQKKKKRHS